MKKELSPCIYTKNACKCPKCKSTGVYKVEQLRICQKCGYNWQIEFDINLEEIRH